MERKRRKRGKAREEETERERERCGFGYGTPTRVYKHYECRMEKSILESKLMISSKLCGFLLWLPLPLYYTNSAFIPRRGFSTGFGCCGQMPWTAVLRHSNENTMKHCIHSNFK